MEMMNPELSPYESSQTALVALLRSRLRDDDYMVRAFTMAVDDPRARSVCAEVHNGQLRITSVGGGLGNITIALAGVDTDTLGGLVDRLKTEPKIRVTPNEAMMTGHPSTDLRIKGHGNIQDQGVHFYHRRWSDEELRSLCHNAARRHNPNYTVDTVPDPEHIFVVTLALSEAAMIQVEDGLKRRGLDVTSETAMAAAQQYEQQYRDDRARQSRFIPVAKIKDSNVEGGDIVQGTFFRTNLRTGFKSPLASQGPPEVPELFTTPEEDIGDVEVRIRWRRVRDTDFYAMELWRDTVPDVRRTQLGNLKNSPQSPVSRPVFPTTSKLVYAPRWVNGRYWTSALASYGVASGQVVNNFVDGLPDRHEHYVGAAWDAPAPEPETTYYYRLYVFDTNREVIGSEVLEVTTKPMRAVFSRDNAVTALAPLTGPIVGGTPCTIRGERFHEGMRVKLGDKFVLNLVIVSPTEATFDTPQIFNEQSVNTGKFDLILTSDTGLQDALLQSWTYTLA